MSRGNTPGFRPRCAVVDHVAASHFWFRYQIAGVGPLSSGSTPYSILRQWGLRPMRHCPEQGQSLRHEAFSFGLNPPSFRYDLSTVAAICLTFSI